MDIDAGCAPKAGPGKLGFPPALRIRRKKEFDLVFEQGRKTSAAGVMLVVARNGLDHARLGVIAAKKLGGSVGRNRTKRVFREAFRLNRGSLPQGVDIVVVPRPVKGGWTLERAVEALKAVRAGP
jgi:ribonuclease P protein component